MIESGWVDLHLHIDGALSVETARILAKMQEIQDLPLEDEELLKSLRAPKPCRNLVEYLKCFELPVSLMQTRDAIRECVRRLQNELKEQGLLAAELRFAPQLHTRQGLTQEEVVQAAVEGLQQSDFRAGLILCCMRMSNNQQANRETIRLADRYREQGVLAIDLAGAEAQYPVDGYRELFEYAKERKVPFTIHAGEAAGADSVRKAIEMGASRIGHGIRASEDESVMKLLAERKIPLELCPTSNLDTSVYESLEDYPILTLIRHGVIITLNSDDPSVSNTTIGAEYSKIQKRFQLSDDEMEHFLLNAKKASWLSFD